MESFGFNGDNDGLEQNSNLDQILSQEMQEKQYLEESNKINTFEINGNSKSTLKTNVSSTKRKFLKRSTSNCAENVEPSSSILLSHFSKRKAYDTDKVNAIESEDFYGFDYVDLENFKSGRHTLQKLIAEAESSNYSNSKCRKVTIEFWKNSKNADNLIDETDDTTSDSEDQKNVHESETALNMIGRLTKPGQPDNFLLGFKKLRKSRPQRLSFGGTVRQKVSIDVANPAYREPFNYGWKRELVYRATTSENQSRRMADIYYYTPEGKKVRSYCEVVKYLTTSNLTIDNFTFFKEPLGVNDPEKEIIRDAKKSKDFLNNKLNNKPSKKSSDIYTIKKSLPKKIEKNAAAITFLKSSKANRKSSSFKIKLPAKKNTIKTIKSPSNLSKENETSSSQWSSPSIKKKRQITDTSSLMKTKRPIKKKQALSEVDDSQFFMVSICAGYNALSRIFQYLKVQELLRAARVCRMWRDLAAHPSLWKTVRMKNSQVTDWEGFAETLKIRQTQHLDLRKMLIVGDTDNVWKKFISVIPNITSLIKLELCKCPAIVVEEVMKNCPQLQILSASSIKCDSLKLETASYLRHCHELKLKAISGMALQGDLSPLLTLTKINFLSLTSIKDLGKKKVEILKNFKNLETLELGECSDFPDKFGTTILSDLHNLERLRLEKGQGSCCTFDILEGISKLKNLTQLELVNFDVKHGFDKYLANCKNIKRLLIIPTYVSQSATSNNMILGGVTELSQNLTHFVWGVTQELLRVTELFVDQCNQMSKHITGDSIPVLKPVPCLELIEDVVGDKDNQKDDKNQSTLSNPQVEILPLPHLQKLLLTALPKTRVKILKIPFHATWRQSISDSTSQ